ncbi:MAG: NfeD family protein [Ilumatobacter sp.]|nr:NfeD family protein [bacterium]MDG1267687.1 NfeD family protein [Ilumatobacter sp.]
MVAVLDLGIDLNAWPWIWIGVAVLFALIELTLLAGSFVLLPFAVSAFIAALAGFYDASVEIQWSIFFFGGAALWVAFWRYAKRFADDNAMRAGVGADRLVGVDAIVTSDIDPNDTERRGRVKVMGEEWGALTSSGRLLRAGSKVRISSMNGTRVMVDAIVLSAPTKPPVEPPPGSPLATPINPASEDS